MSDPQLATERIYKTLDGDYVGEGDPAAAFLAAGVGDPLPDGYAPSSKAVKAAPNKAVKAAGADK